MESKASWKRVRAGPPVLLPAAGPGGPRLVGPETPHPFPPTIREGMARPPCLVGKAMAGAGQGQELPS